MILEAMAGKNPVRHVGKIYNVVARNIAETIALDCEVDRIVGQQLEGIGALIDRFVAGTIELYWGAFRAGGR
jgi:S-adenosylmethionine synthetase